MAVLEVFTGVTELEVRPIEVDELIGVDEMAGFDELVGTALVELVEVANPELLLATDWQVENYNRCEKQAL